MRYMMRLSFFADTVVSLCALSCCHIAHSTHSPDLYPARLFVLRLLHSCSLFGYRITKSQHYDNHRIGWGWVFVIMIIGIYSLNNREL